MEAALRPPVWKTLLAFAIVYLVWGSTYLAIRVGVREVPPLTLAAMRFLPAGLALFLWCVARGERLPEARQWLSAAFLALMIFVFDYGLLFWAERRVPSGIAAVLMAVIPVFMALAEIVLLRTRRLTLRLGGALLFGLAGVAILTLRSFDFGGAPIDTPGALALIFASLSFSIASVLTRKLPLPASRVMSSGIQMLTGGLWLCCAAAMLGEFGQFHPAAVSRGAWLALLYLIVAGSIVAYTAYVWLLHHQSPAKVGTYAYVNPVVAVWLGNFAGGEVIDRRTIFGIVAVLAAVFLIVSSPAGTPAKAVERAGGLD